jgi:NodT family efflux transporter outer membrane factor (OMF) lipoprotein
MFKLHLLAASLVLAGCASAPLPPPAAPDLPTAWQGADAGTAVDWAGGLDPQLAGLQAQALSASRDIAQAALRWQQATTQAQLGGLRLQPSLGLSSSASRPLDSQSSSRTVNVGGVDVPVTTAVGWSRSYGASASLAYELDLWNRLSSAEAALAADAEAARTDIASARTLIRTRVAEAYWTLAASAAQRPLAQTQLDQAQEALQLTTLRVREGKLLPIEIDKAASAVQAAQVRLADLQADGQLQRHQLALLLDQPPPGPRLIDPHLPGQAVPQWALAAPAEVLAGRPDVQRARLQVDAALARLHAAQAERYPRLSFSAALSTGGVVTRDWLSQPLLSLAANLAVPLIDWRRLDLQQSSARTELELAALGLRDTLYKALVEVEGQLIERERLQQQLAANELRLNEAREAERLAALRLAVGSIARLDWLQARNATLDAEQGRIQLELRAWLNHAGTFKALGGPG